MSDKEIIIEDDGIKKYFYIRKFKATKFMFFTNQMLSMISKTDEIQPAIIKQYFNNKLTNGVTEHLENGDKVDPQITEEAVNKELAENYFGLMFNIVKSMLANIEYHQDPMLESILSCILYGDMKIPLTMNHGDGNVDMIIKDGMNLYKLCWEVIKHNYSIFF